MLSQGALRFQKKKGKQLPGQSSTQSAVGKTLPLNRLKPGAEPDSENGCKPSSILIKQTAKQTYGPLGWRQEYNQKKQKEHLRAHPLTVQPLGFF